jgi:hypothetical protein
LVFFCYISTAIETLIIRLKKRLPTYKERERERERERNIKLMQLKEKKNEL